MDGLEILHGLEARSRIVEWVILKACTRLRRPTRLWEIRLPPFVRCVVAWSLISSPIPDIATDPLLNSIHSETEFEQILEAARQRHEAFRRSFF
jgi:hypothetical protein